MALQCPWFFHPSVIEEWKDTPRMKTVDKSKVKSPICFDKDLTLWGY
jgi:hypothetical protein